MAISLKGTQNARRKKTSYALELVVDNHVLKAVALLLHVGLEATHEVRVGSSENLHERIQRVAELHRQRGLLASCTTRVLIFAISLI